MWRKFFMFLIVLANLFTFTGCGQQEVTNKGTTPTEESVELVKVNEIDEMTIIRDNVNAFYNRYPDDKYITTVEQIKDQIDNLYVIDVRPPDSFAKGHLPKANNFPLKQMGNNLDKLPDNQTILVICTNGQSAAQTAGILNTAGYNALSLSGGYLAWVDAGLPVEQ